MPQLLDPNFHRTVVLLIHHGEDGTFGVVINRGTEYSAPTLCASLEIDWHGDPGESIAWGGPVQPQTGWMLFDESPEVAGQEDVKHLGDGICFAGSIDVLRELAQEPSPQLRLLLGYAGWGPGQLEAELSEGAWLTAPVSREVLFHVDYEDVWVRVLRDLGIEPATLVASRGVH